MVFYLLYCFCFFIKKSTYSSKSVSRSGSISGIFFTIGNALSEIISGLSLSNRKSTDTLKKSASLISDEKSGSLLPLSH